MEKGVLTNDEVLHELVRDIYDVIIIGGGVDGETRTSIKQLIAEKTFL